MWDFLLKNIKIDTKIFTNFDNFDIITEKFL